MTEFDLGSSVVPVKVHLESAMFGLMEGFAVVAIIYQNWWFGLLAFICLADIIGLIYGNRKQDREERAEFINRPSWAG